jgi:hypothetical protein
MRSRGDEERSLRILTSSENSSPISRRYKAVFPVPLEPLICTIDDWGATVPAACTLLDLRGSACSGATATTDVAASGLCFAGTAADCATVSSSAELAAVPITAFLHSYYSRLQMINMWMFFGRFIISVIILDYFLCL